MDNVLQDMVQRLRAIELLLRTQNELLTRVFAEAEQNGRGAEATRVLLPPRSKIGRTCRESCERANPNYSTKHLAACREGCDRQALAYVYARETKADADIAKVFNGNLCEPSNGSFCTAGAYEAGVATARGSSSGLPD